METRPVPKPLLLVTRITFWLLTLPRLPVTKVPPLNVFAPAAMTEVTERLDPPVDSRPSDPVSVPFSVAVSEFVSLIRRPVPLDVIVDPAATVHDLPANKLLPTSKVEFPVTVTNEPVAELDVFPTNSSLPPPWTIRFGAPKVFLTNNWPDMVKVLALLRVKPNRPFVVPMFPEKLELAARFNVSVLMLLLFAKALLLMKLPFPESPVSVKLKLVVVASKSRKSTL